jgi:dynactin complex subunit
MIVGSNDGSLDGKRYFTTTPNRGVFVKPTEVTLA